MDLSPPAGMRRKAPAVARGCVDVFWPVWWGDTPNPSNAFLRVEPVRAVFDSLSEMRLLAQNSLRYRRQILALKHFFTGRRCTVMLLDDLSSEINDLQLHSIAHSVVTLEQMALDYGSERRRLRVVKMRGIDFRGGYHDFHRGSRFWPSRTCTNL